MVVYYTTTYYHVLCAIIHRILYEPDSQAVILVSDSRVEHEKLCERLEKSGIFNKVIYYEDRLIVSNASRRFKHLPFKFNMKRILKDMYKEVEKITPFEINTENKYYLMSDFRPLGLYLIKNKINYYYFEDACGVLSRKHLLMNALKSKWTNKVIEVFNLNGENELVINRYADKLAQEEGFEDEKLIDFSVKKLVYKLKQEDKNKILEIFNIRKIPNDNRKKALILTQPFIQRNKISFDNQKEMYELLMDYFCRDMDIYIKPHPLDKLSAYSKWFPDAKILDGQMPSELLNVIVEDKFDVGISVSSTAIFSLDEFIKSIIILDSDAENRILNINKYYAISKILENIDIKENDVYLKNVNQKILENMIKYNTNIKKLSQFFEYGEEDNFEYKEKEIYICDKIEDNSFVEKLDDEDVLILLNYTNLYKDDKNFISKYQDYSRNIRLTIEESKKQEDILVYTKSKEKLKKLDNLDVQNELIHSNLNLKINSYTFMSEEMKDKVINILKKELKNKED